MVPVSSTLKMVITRTKPAYFKGHYLENKGLLRSNRLLYRSPHKSLHISKGNSNLRITKNGEELVAPLKTIEDISMIPTVSTQTSVKNDKELSLSFPPEKQQEDLLSEDDQRIESFQETKQETKQETNERLASAKAEARDLLISLQSRIEKENAASSNLTGIPFIENINSIMQRLEKLNHLTVASADVNPIVDYIKKGNLLNTHIPTPFTDINVKEIIDDLTESNTFSESQAKILAYNMIHLLNTQIYKNHSYKYVKTQEFEKIALLLDNRIQAFKLKKEKQVEQQQQDLDLAFELLNHSISLAKESFPHVIENDLKRESQIDIKNHQNDINDSFEDLNLQLKNTRYLITVHVLGGLQVKVDEYRWFTMRLTVTAMGLMVFLLTLIIWGNSASNKGNREEVQTSVVLKALENEVLDEDNIPDHSKQRKDYSKITESKSNGIVENSDMSNHALSTDDLKQSSVSELE